MRLLVACTACKRQLDASGREPGSRFHCSCGAVLAVPRPQGHDAYVVRCSSCGAPREGEAETCRFCGSEFTLHERDLHTVCPECFARISDRASFCHHCGIPIAPQGTVGETAAETCPVCGDDRRLVSRRLGGRDVTVLECGVCAGLWVGRDIFQVLETRARERATTLMDDGRGPVPPLPGALQEGPLYRPCVVCGQLMHRRNYGQRSGVILDLCHDHGLWFDVGELGQALRWVRQGGLHKAERLAVETRKEEERRERFRRLTEVPPVEQTHRGGGWWATGAVVDVLADILGIVFDI